MMPATHRNRDELTSLRNKLALVIKEMKLYLHLLDDTLNQTVIDRSEKIFLNNREKTLVDFIDDRVDYAVYLNRCIRAFDTYQTIEYNHPRKSRTPERTHFRDISFSLWHRSLDPNCYTLDLDFLEMRKEAGVWTPKMIYDIKRGSYDIGKLKDWNKDYLSHLTVYKSFADALDIPFAVIAYKPDLSLFTMYTIESAPPELDYRTTRMNERGMREFIEGL